MKRITLFVFSTLVLSSSAKALKTWERTYELDNGARIILKPTN